MYVDKFANYSGALHRCRQPIREGGAGGTLAHVLSELRTNSLASFVRRQRNDSRLDVALIGLGTRDTPDNHQKNRRLRFVTSTAEPMECFLYRAWEPGHPKRMSRRQPGCVAISAAATWKMFSCSKWLPYICEINPTRPKRKLKNLRRKCAGKN